MRLTWAVGHNAYYTTTMPFRWAANREFYLPLSRQLRKMAQYDTF